MRATVSLLCCDGPCCGPELAEALRSLEGRVRFEVATCLSECEKAPVVRVRFGEGGRRTTSLLSGSGRPELVSELQAWVDEGSLSPLPRSLREAEFSPGEGGGCLCDEEQPAVTTPLQGR